MKKAILTLILINIVTLTMAQGYYLRENRVRLGFNVSPTISLLQPQESGTTRNGARLGVGFGLMADFYIDRAGRYAFASGLQVITAGSKLKYDAGKGLDDYKATPAEYNLKTTYVEIPAAIKLKAITTSGAGIWGQFGTYLDFPVRGRADVVTLNNSFDKVNVLRDIQPINLGMLISVGLEYPLGDHLSAVAGLDYKNGFVDVTRNAKWNDGKVNMNSFALRLGLFF